LQFDLQPHGELVSQHLFKHNGKKPDARKPADQTFLKQKRTKKSIFRFFRFPVGFIKDNGKTPCGVFSICDPTENRTPISGMKIPRPSR
jgi:hypothetical protein